MPSNYRKSAGRFGEENDDDGVDRPPFRPSTNVPNFLHAIDRPCDETTATFSDDTTDPVLTRTLIPTSLSNEEDDMSSLGNETAAFSIIAPSLPGDLPYYQPMTDEEWKEIVTAATKRRVSGRRKTTVDTSTVRESNNSELTCCFPVVEDDFDLQQCFNETPRSPSGRDDHRPSREERDRIVDRGNGSLEYAIALKPKPRPKYANPVHPNKGPLLVQRMWGNLGGGIRVRGNNRVTKVSV